MHVAAEDVLGFYRNYHSMRWVGDQLVIRMQHGPTDEQLAELNQRFGEIATDGRIERTEPLPAEVKDDDHLDLDRIVLRYNGFAAGKLRRLINAINRSRAAPTDGVVAAQRRGGGVERLADQGEPLGKSVVADRSSGATGR